MTGICSCMFDVSRGGYMALHQAVFGYESETKGRSGTGTLKVMVRFGRNFRGHRCPAEEVRFFWQN
jgi:hypothetical protein